LLTATGVTPNSRAAPTKLPAATVRTKLTMPRMLSTFAMIANLRLVLQVARRI